MRVVRTIVAVIAIAGLAACGSSKEPASDRSAAPAEQPAAETAGPPVAFAQCMSCHSVKPGVNGVGPSLLGVVGRKAAAVPGYAYSEPLKNAGLTWDEATLDKWLTAPMTMVPGTKMVFPGITDAARRKAAIDYLATLK
jgi:cytochrome c